MLCLSARSYHSVLLLQAPRNEICTKNDTIASGGFSIINQPCPIFIGASSKLYKRMMRERKAMLNGRFEVTEDPFYSAPMLIGWSLHELSDLVH